MTQLPLRDSDNVDLIKSKYKDDDVRTRSGRLSDQAKAPRRKSWVDDISDGAWIWTFLLILLTLYFTFWRQEKFFVGFCDVPQSERIFFFH
jgi:hypothetical protein